MPIMLHGDQAITSAEETRALFRLLKLGLVKKQFKTCRSNQRAAF